MVSASTKRKRRDRANRTTLAIEQSRHDAQTERSALGTAITPDAPDESLFQIDRKGETKTALIEKHAADAREQRLAAKRARRAQPHLRKSEVGAAPRPDASPEEAVLPYVAKKKYHGVPTVEAHILATRNFDKPEGHIGNLSELRREAARHVDGSEDVWNSELADTVENEITDTRRNMVHKLTRKSRQAPAVLYPDPGLSVNPAYEHHQDKLGEAVASVISFNDKKRWNAKKLSFDPALLLEDKGGEFGDTGMKTDVSAITVTTATTPMDASDAMCVDTAEANENDNDDDTGIVQPVRNTVPERKTRSQRNKEARTRVMQSNISKNRRETRQSADFLRFDAVLADAEVEADKLNGVKRKKPGVKGVYVPRNVSRPIVRMLGGRVVRKESLAEPVSLSKELGDGLRDFKTPVTNPMLNDRLLSFERRGMVEPPSALPVEVMRMAQEKRRVEMLDPRKRRGKHSKSKISYWKEKSVKKRK